MDDEILTTGQAARLLGMSRVHIVQLMEKNFIPFFKVGVKRRVYLKDILAYQAAVTANGQTNRKDLYMQQALYLFEKSKKM